MGIVIGIVVVAAVVGFLYFRKHKDQLKALEAKIMDLEQKVVHLFDHKNK